MEKKIIFNGQEYSSIDEMPPAVQREYRKLMGMFADADGNGVPDILEGGSARVEARVEQKFVVNGREYNSLDEVPPHLRGVVEEMMARGNIEQRGGRHVVQTIVQTDRSGDRGTIPLKILDMEFGGSQNSMLTWIKAAIVVLVLIVAALLAVLFFGME